jgi:Flp pilus assembly protein TadD
MSVINKMLRDLDARKQLSLSPLEGTMSWGGAVQPQRRLRLWLGGVLMLLAGLVLLMQMPGRSEGGHWQLEAPVRVHTMAPSEVAVVLPESAKPTEPVEEVLEETRSSAQRNLMPQALPRALMLKLSEQLASTDSVKSASTWVTEPPLGASAAPRGKEVVHLSAKETTKENTKEASQETSQEALKEASKDGAQGLAKDAAKDGAKLAQSKEVEPDKEPQVRVNKHVSVQENLQQAQQLWHSGAKDSAMDVLRSTLQSLERGGDTAQAASDTSVLVREWSRMALAQDRAPEVMALIKRHATQVANQSEVWALKGQAAQRLGLHQDAVEAYTHALALRPNEGRWVLASAVSMAALGNTDAAARMLQKARAQGPINAEILAYLKQAGVNTP